MSDAIAILRLAKVKDRTGLSRSSLYAEMAKGKFPKSVSLTDDGRSVGWLSSEVDAWVAARAARAEKKTGAK